MKRIGFFGKTGFRKHPGGGVRFSITFKTTAAYTLMFGVALAVAVAGLTSVLTTYTIRTQNLDRLSTFVSDHFSRPGGPKPTAFISSWRTRRAAPFTATARGTRGTKGT